MCGVGGSAIEACFRTSFSTPTSSTGCADIDGSRGRGRSGADRRRGYVGIVDSRVVAFANCGPERVEMADGTVALSADRGEVYGFYAHPDAWGSGVAAALMAVSEDHLRQIGFINAVLWVLRDNPRAHAFYRKANWQPSDVTGRFEWRPGHTIEEVQFVTDLRR